VELCHNASLIHDDIEDKSPERRGKPAVHVLYGEDVAINTGAFLYFLAGRCIDRSALSDTEKLRAYQTWSRYMRRLHLGQSMDIGWHRDSDTFPSEELYYTMCRLKTGCLAAFAVEIGAIAANNDAQTANLRKAALEFGVGFQILDDVKNLKGDIKGKNKADDLVEGKKSLPILLYVNSGSENERKERKKLVQSAFNEASHTGNSENEQCSRLLEALTTSGALAQAQEKAEKFIQGAEDVFADFKNLMK
jgi:octaprenyl-diphosphate synthase